MRNLKKTKDKDHKKTHATKYFNALNSPLNQLMDKREVLAGKYQKK